VSARTFWAFLGVLAVVGLLGYGLVSKGAASADIGQPVADRELPTLDGAGSGRIADHRGEWVLVNLWASWCLPCKQESPALQSFYRAERGHDFIVLGVDSQDLSQNGLQFVHEYGITYPQLHDGPGDLGDDLGATGYPESFLVDPQGKLRLFREHPEALRTLQLAYQCVLADEAQDLDPTQWALLELLAAEHRNLVVVGDPVQTLLYVQGRRCAWFAGLQAAPSDRPGGDAGSQPPRHTASRPTGQCVERFAGLSPWAGYRQPGWPGCPSPPSGRRARRGRIRRPTDRLAY